MSFADLGLIKPLLSTLSEQGYETPTPIQKQSIPLILQGRDVVGLAQTGTGKTAAFALPLLQNLFKNPVEAKKRPVRMLVCSPTRELAAQIEKNISDYAKRLSIRSTCVVGGVPINRQKNVLNKGVDVLVATPGRLLDLVAQGSVSLSQVEAVVLDEADHMLDIGFLPAIKKILAMVPARRQTLLFSATMPKEIKDLSANHLRNPLEVSVTPENTTVEKITQSVLHIHPEDKMSAIAKLVKEHPGKRIIVFTRTKRGADKVVKKLGNENLAAEAIHGNKSQGQRERALANFRSGAAPVLIATDIAARGIDVPGVEIVVNYELPNVPEAYVHRIGRTARAGASGMAVSFCSTEEQKLLRAIEKLIKISIPASSVGGQPLPKEGPVGQKKPARNGGPAKKKWGGPRRNGGGGNASAGPAGGEGGKPAGGAPSRRRRAKR